MCIWEDFARFLALYGLFGMMRTDIRTMGSESELMVLIAEALGTPVICGPHLSDDGGDSTSEI